MVNPQRVHAQGKLVLRGYENSDWEYVRVEDALGNSTSMSAALLGMSSQALTQGDGGLQVSCYIQLGVTFRLPRKKSQRGICNDLQSSCT